MYKLIKPTIFTTTPIVLKDGVQYIPFDLANTDYQAYLAWLEEGNTPEPAEVTE